MSNHKIDYPDQKKTDFILLSQSSEIEKLPVSIKTLLDVNFSSEKSTSPSFILGGKKHRVDANTYYTVMGQDNNMKTTPESDKIDGNREVSDMSNDSFQTLFQELKTDMREREQRTREDIIRREELFEKQLSSFTQAAEKREERMYALVDGIKNDISQSEQRITNTVVASEQRIQDTESRINQSMDDMKADFSDIKQEVTKQVEHLNNMERQNFWGFFAVTATIFIGMLAIVITLITQL